MSRETSSLSILPFLTILSSWLRSFLQQLTLPSEWAEIDKIATTPVRRTIRYVSKGGSEVATFATFGIELPNEISTGHHFVSTAKTATTSTENPLRPGVLDAPLDTYDTLPHGTLELLENTDLIISTIFENDWNWHLFLELLSDDTMAYALSFLTFFDLMSFRHSNRQFMRLVNLSLTLRRLTELELTRINLWWNVYAIRSCQISQFFCWDSFRFLLDAQFPDLTIVEACVPQLLMDDSPNLTPSQRRERGHRYLESRTDSISLSSKFSIPAEGFLFCVLCYCDNGDVLLSDGSKRVICGSIWSAFHRLVKSDPTDKFHPQDDRSFSSRHTTMFEFFRKKILGSKDRAIGLVRRNVGNSRLIVEFVPESQERVSLKELQVFEAIETAEEEGNLHLYCGSDFWLTLLCGNTRPSMQRVSDVLRNTMQHALVVFEANFGRRSLGNLDIWMIHTDVVEMLVSCGLRLPMKGLIPFIVRVAEAIADGIIIQRKISNSSFSFFLTILSDCWEYLNTQKRFETAITKDGFNEKRTFESLVHRIAKRKDPVSIQSLQILELFVRRFDSIPDCLNNQIQQIQPDSGSRHVLYTPLQRALPPSSDPSFLLWLHHHIGIQIPTLEELCGKDGLETELLKSLL